MLAIFPCTRLAQYSEARSRKGHEDDLPSSQFGQPIEEKEYK
jgi:hypothetical protein